MFLLVSSNSKTANYTSGLISWKAGTAKVKTLIRGTILSAVLMRSDMLNRINNKIRRKYNKNIIMAIYSGYIYVLVLRND